MENTQVNTDGGTVVHGNVHAERDFIGRDKIENHIYPQPKIDPDLLRIKELFLFKRD